MVRKGLTKEYLIENYSNERKTLNTIALELGISRKKVSKFIDYWNIPRITLSERLKGKRNSKKTEFKRGRAPWNKGKTGVQISTRKGIVLSDELKQEISLKTKIAMQRPEVIRKIKRTQFKKESNPWNKGKKNVYSIETINKIKSKRLRQKFPKQDTQIEVKLFKCLDNLNITYKKHHPIMNICQSDAFIEPNIAIFADGDYWHCNPKVYTSPKTEAQLKNVLRDKQVNTKLKSKGFTIIRLWETDINNSPEYCIQEIKKVLK